MRSGYSKRNTAVAVSCLITIWATGMALALRAEQPVPAPTVEPHPLVWDAINKTIEAKPGQTNATFEFTVTNASVRPVTIEQIRPTCGCTIAEMPSSPWIIAPHASGSFVGVIDFRRVDESETKALFVNSTSGTQVLRITVKIPAIDESVRREHQRIAQVDRQAVFRGDCARCHAAPSEGLAGKRLFMTACGMCHFSNRRASMVPDLLTARQHRDATFWRGWISDGKAGTLMPAWSKQHGGPLTEEQIDSLVRYALETLPTEPRPAR